MRVLVAASVAMPLILLTHSRQLSLSALDCLKCCWPIQVVADPYSEEDDDSSFSLCRSRSSRLPQECIKHDFPFACLPRCDLLACILVVQLASTFYHKSNWIDIANCRRGERIYLNRSSGNWKKGLHITVRASSGDRRHGKCLYHVTGLIKHHCQMWHPSLKNR